MKKAFITILLFLFGIVETYSFSYYFPPQFHFSACVNNRWSRWSEYNFNYYVTIYHRKDCDNTDSFAGLLFEHDYHSEWCFELMIEDFSKPNKKAKKYHLKNGVYYFYNGYVNYFVTDEYPTIEDVLMKFGFPAIPADGKERRVKRHAKATIRIEPYKKAPQKIYIHFDNVTVALSFPDDFWGKENLRLFKSK